MYIDFSLVLNLFGSSIIIEGKLIVISLLLIIVSLIVFFILMHISLEKHKEREHLLENKNKNKDLFFSIISHDLKGPSQNMIGLSKLLINDKDLRQNEYHHLGELIHSSANKQYQLLNNLLDWSANQMENCSVMQLPCDIYEMMESNFIFFQDRATEKQLTLLNQIPPKTYLNTDYNMLTAILRNLLNNAVKFSPCGGKIVASMVMKSNYFEIKIKDQGVGMDRETVDNLFNTNKRKSARGTNNEEGSGMGLILCKQLADKLGTDLHVQSEQGKGTSFSIIFNY